MQRMAASERLAQLLNSYGLLALERRTRSGEFAESNGKLMLLRELDLAAGRESDCVLQLLINRVRLRVIRGEFD